MKISKLNPTSPGCRHQIIINKNLLSKNNKFIKSLNSGFNKNSGRSNQTGNITVWHKGGGCKKLYRKLNFTDIESTTITLSNCYDPYRNSFISLRFNLAEKKFDLVTMTNFVFPGSLSYSGIKFSELKLGFRTLLLNIPTGSFIHNLSLKKNKIIFARSAGNFCQIIQKREDLFKIRLPSGKFLDIIDIENSSGTIGIVSNLEQKQICLGKAGKNRVRGIRPTVRGIAMNPVDHPHGGRTNGGMNPVSP